MTLDSWAEQRQAAHEAGVVAVAQVEANAEPEWLESAKRAVRIVALNHMMFSTDDVWDLLDSAPHEPRAMGAVMRIMAKQGFIVATGSYLTSRRVECHGRPVRLWMSRLRESE